MLDPHPLTPQTFAQRMREVDMPTSEAIFFELKGVGIIQADNCSRFLEYETWCGMPLIFMLCVQSFSGQPNSCKGAGQLLFFC